MNFSPQPSKFPRLGTMFNTSSAPAALGSSNPPPSPKSYPSPRDKKGTRRIPVLVNFAGTLWPKGNPAVGKDRQPLVNANQDKLRDAVMVLSQSTTARELLRTMTSYGYKIIFDDDSTNEQGAAGLCDPNSKRIKLQSDSNVYELAMVLAHESVHACQSLTDGIFPNNTYKPEIAIGLSFAIEADAHAQTVQIALELAYGDLTRNQKQVLYPEALMSLRDSNPDMITAAQAQVKTRADLESGRGLAAAFESFYDDTYMRFFYEDSHMTWCEDLAEKTSAKNPSLTGKFRSPLNPQWLMDNLTWQGKPYLRQLLPTLDFSDTRHSGLTALTILRVNQFYDDYLPADKKPVLRKFPLRRAQKADAKITPKPPANQ